MNPTNNYILYLSFSSILITTKYFLLFDKNTLTSLYIYIGAFLSTPVFELCCFCFLFYFISQNQAKLSRNWKNTNLNIKR